MVLEELLDLLNDVNVLCRDNGVKFDKKNCERIKAIKEKLKDSSYKCTEKDLFLLFHKKDLGEYTDGTVLISSHIDCKQMDGEDEYITKCFSERVSENIIKGTYDNSLTNTAILSLMMEGRLSDNVIVAFTGDEEEDSEGALHTVKLLKKYGFKYKCIVLDVTDAGWKEKIDFTIENNFWNNKMGRKVISDVRKYSENWLFVPEEMDNIPDYVPKDKIYYTEAERDESWDYDEEKIRCFSLCIPVNGEMHSDEGVFARISSFESYIEILCLLSNEVYI